MTDDLLTVRKTKVVNTGISMERMIERFKRINEIENCECPKGKKDCFLCEYKYPYKVHKAYKSWIGDPVCTAVERNQK